jgi:hypothetical protein
VKTVLFVLSMGVLICSRGSAEAQQNPAPQNPVQLELTMEVATTTEDGLPAALRFTLRNVGYVAVDLPLPVLDCVGSSGTIRVKSKVHLEGAPPSTGKAHGCGYGRDHELPIAERIRTQWFHLLPGEHLNLTGDRRILIDKVDAPATYDYWAEYEPPALTPDQRAEAARSGYLVPTETVQSDHLSYSEL